MLGIRIWGLTVLLVTLSVSLLQNNIEASESSMMTGNTMDLRISPELPFDYTKNENVILTFIPKAPEFEGQYITPGYIDHLNYTIAISRDGMEIWKHRFHAHDGKLELQFLSTSGPTTISGGEQNMEEWTTAPFIISGPIFSESGNYFVSARVFEVELEPLMSPHTDEFAIHVVPEFPMAILPIGIALGVAVIAFRLSKYR